MKNLIYNRTQHFLVLLLLLASVRTNAQNKAEKNRPDTTGEAISKRLSVSKEKAKQIQTAFNYRHADFERLLKDSTMKPGDKQLQVKRLLAERRRKIDSTVTSPQKQVLSQDYFAQKEMQRRAELEKRHIMELNKIPHQRVLKTVNADTTKGKNKSPLN